MELDNIPSLDGEEWRDIPGYEGHYMVSNMGRVYSHKNKRLKAMFVSNSGYLSFGIYNNKIKRTRTLHRIVASSFIPNPDNKPEVNHKNGIKSDNRVDNLEWCTRSENVIHSYRELGVKGVWLGKKGYNNPFSKAVYQYSKDGTFIKKYGSMSEAERITGIFNQQISSCCSGKIKSSGGFVWRLSPAFDDEEISDLDRIISGKEAKIVIDGKEYTCVIK